MKWLNAYLPTYFVFCGDYVERASDVERAI